MLLEILHLIASTAIELNVDTVRIVDDWSIPMMKGLCLNTYGWYFSSCLERARLASEVSTVFVGHCEPPRESVYIQVSEVSTTSYDSETLEILAAAFQRPSLLTLSIE